MTHLLASWVVGAKFAGHERDCRLVALAGVLPDADGLGLLADAINAAMGQKSLYYLHYHHYLLHGWLGALLIASALAVFARSRLRVLLLGLLVIHLHFLLDFVGSRGPSPEDLWPIFYHGPFDKDPMWIWKGQWRLDSWINRVFTLGLFGFALWIAIQKGYSFVGVFSRKADRIFTGVIQRWAIQRQSRRTPPSQPTA